MWRIKTKFSSVVCFELFKLSNYHLTLQEIAFGNGLENAPVKQEPLKYNKSNKSESSKPKNTASVSRQSDRKEKSSVPRNSNKQAAWK